MRELSLHDMQFISGANLYSEYTIDELTPISVTAGYAVGDFINRCRTGNNDSSVGDLTRAMTACGKIFKQARSIVFFMDIRPLNAFFSFGCGIYQGYVRRTKSSRQKRA